MFVLYAVVNKPSRWVTHELQGAELDRRARLWHRAATVSWMTWHPAANEGIPHPCPPSYPQLSPFVLFHNHHQHAPHFCLISSRLMGIDHVYYVHRDRAQPQPSTYPPRPGCTLQCLWSRWWHPGCPGAWSFSSILLAPVSPLTH